MKYILYLMLSIPLFATDRFVSASASGGSGTYNDPWDLQTALTNSNVSDGDVIYIRGCKLFTGTSGCTYDGPFNSDLQGSSGSRITVRNYPGEVAYLSISTCTGSEETLEITGDYTTYKGVWPGWLAVLNSCSIRTGGAGVFRSNGIEIQSSADNNILEELLVYDTGIAIVDAGTNNSVIDSLIFNNGKRNVSGDFTNGHGIYPSSTGSTYYGNVVTNNYGVGIHVYGTGGSGRNISYNIVFNNGMLTPTYGPYSQFLAEDYDGSSGTIDTITYNKFYLPKTLSGNGTVGAITFEIGCYNPTTQLGNFTIQYNHISGGGGSTGPASSIGLCYLGSSSVFSNNINTSQYTHVVGTLAAVWTANNNTWLGANLGGTPNTNWTVNATPLDFAGWQGAPLNWDASGSYSATYPTSNVVYMTTSSYNSNRANLTVYNYAGGNTVSLDISSVATQGKKVYIFNSQNWNAGPVWQGIYSGGNVTLPTNSVSADPIGDSALSTDVNFASYILIQEDSEYVSQVIE